MSTPHGPEPEPDGPPPAGLPDHRPHPGGANDPGRYGPIDPFGGRYPDYPAAGGPPSGSSPGNRPYGGPVGDDPLVPPDFGGWVSRVVEVSRRSFTQVALVQLVGAVVSAVLGVVLALNAPDPRVLTGSTAPGEVPGLLGFFVTAIVVGLVSFVVSAFLWGASIYVSVRDAAGTPTTATEGLRFSPRRAAPMLGWSVVAVILVTVGGFALLLPGIYLLVVLFASLYGVVAVERDGIGRCFTLIRNRFWATFGRLLVAGIALGVYAGVIGFITSALGGGQYGVVKSIVQPFLMLPAAVAAVAVVVVTYAELRWYEDNSVTTPGLAAQMLDR